MSETPVADATAVTFAGIVNQIALGELGLAQSNAQRDSALAQVAVLTGTVANLHDEIDRLNAVIAGGPGPVLPPPDPDPDSLPPPTARMFVGACVNSTPSAVVTKFGEGCALRSFSDEKAGFNKPQRPAGVGLWMHSWKPPIGTNLTDAQLIGMFGPGTPFKPGDAAELWHEAAVKYRSGKLTRAQIDQIVAMKIAFDASINRLRSAGQIVWVETVFTDAAYMWDAASLYPGTATDPSTAAFWGKTMKGHADLIGVDFDAYKSPNAYPNFVKVVANVVAFVLAYDFDGWIAPEVAHERIASDPTGAARAKWMTTTFQAMSDAAVRPRAAMWFDLPWSGFDLVLKPGTPEFAALKAFV